MNPADVMAAIEAAGGRVRLGSDPVAIDLAGFRATSTAGLPSAVDNWLARADKAAR